MTIIAIQFEFVVETNSKTQKIFWTFTVDAARGIKQQNQFFFYLFYKGDSAKSDGYIYILRRKQTVKILELSMWNLLNRTKTP